MKRGDIIFLKGRVIARAARSIAIPKGSEYRFAWPRSQPPVFLSEEANEEMNTVGFTASIRCFFELDVVRLWELTVPEGADPRVSWNQVGLFVPYSPNPSSDAAGMVTALDLILAEIDPDGNRQSMVAHYIAGMREHFGFRAGAEAVPL